MDMFQKKRDKRFRLIHEESLHIGASVQILADTETGVQYLYFGNGYGGGLTPLLDAQGQPVLCGAGDYDEE